MFYYLYLLPLEEKYEALQLREIVYNITGTYMYDPSYIPSIDEFFHPLVVRYCELARKQFVSETLQSLSNQK